MNGVRLERLADGVAIVRLEAPERRNALVGDMARALVSALHEADGDPTVGAVIISGGPETFCAGAHRELLAAVAIGAAERAGQDLASVYEIFSTLRGLEASTVAAICGPAVGAGLNLALACDLRIVGHNAYLRSMFVANGIHPAGGHLRMLAALGGRALAVRMAVLDEPLDAPAAVAAGLAVGPINPGDVEGEAIRMARRAAAQPALARWINRSITVVADPDDERAAALEAEAQQITLRRRPAAA